MVEPQHHHLLGYELRLLRCTLFPPPPSPPSPSTAGGHSGIEELISSIEAGSYLQALSSVSKPELFGFSLPELPGSPGKVYLEIINSFDKFIKDGGDKSDEELTSRVVVVLCAAVASFFCFIQKNITGPLDELPGCPLPSKVLKEVEFAEWESWARNQLMSDGSHLLGKFYNLQYIVFAKMLIMRTKDLLFEGSFSSTYGSRSISWWLARILLIQQRIMAERSSSLFDLVKVFMGETLRDFGTLEQVSGYWDAWLNDGEANAILSMLNLEVGIMEHTYGRVDSCRLHFKSAEVAAGVQLSVTGVLGFRTVHQVEPKAQRALVANRSSLNRDDTSPSTSFCIQKNDSKTDGDSVVQHEQDDFEVTDILKIPKLLGDGNESEIQVQGKQNGGAAPLNGIQQAVALAQCLLLERSSRQDELQSWDVAPFIEAVDSQPSSCFTLRCFCDLLRIRWESTRSRTKGRAIEMMEKLVESVRKPSSGVAERIPFCTVAFITTIPALLKEYGEVLVSCGLVGEAMKIFEGLELWDNVIYCNRLLGKKAAAVELIRKRLSEMPNDPSLWCSLGDVTNEDHCYEKALEVSNDKSARAKRSLARSAYNRGDYETSKTLWESAMAMNALYRDGWFALGAAALKARDVEKALDGFTRAVQLDPENGEAWNNIACLHMIKKKSKKSFIAFKEALKLKRDSWQMWENYGHVAMDVGDIRQALEAVQKVLHLSNCKRIDTALLERIMHEMEGRFPSKEPVPPASTPDLTGQAFDCCNEVVDESDLSLGTSQETEQLVELVGKVLQQIVKSESRADVWGLYARWQKIRGDLTMCSEALLKQVRSYQGSDLWKDTDRFKKYAKASLDLCNVYIEIASRTGSRRELSAAEMHLRNVIRQAEHFSDTEEFKDLQACLDKVKMQLLSNPTHKLST